MKTLSLCKSTSNKNTSNTSYWNMLPDELVMYILLFLIDQRNSNTLLAWRLTCKRFRSLYFDNFFFKRHCIEKLSYMMKKQHKSANQCAKWAAYKGNMIMLEYLFANWNITNINGIILNATKQNNKSIIHKYIDRKKICGNIILKCFRIGKDKDIQDYFAYLWLSSYGLSKGAYYYCEACLHKHIVSYNITYID